MIKRQFIRFYLLLLLSCATLLIALGGIYHWLSEDQQRYQLDVDQIFAQPGEPPKLNLIPRHQLHFPPDIALLLQQGQVVAVDLANGTSLYYRQHTDAELIAQFGPMPTAELKTEHWLDLLLYVALALLFLGLLWPLFRDIRLLMHKTAQFAQTPTPIASGIRPQASLYPLAQSVERMSQQVSQLIELNQDISRTVAHETRTPLSRMKFTLSLAASQLEPRFQQQLQHDIEEIEHLVSNYLDFSRLEYFQVQQPLLPIYCADLLQELTDRFDIYQHHLQLKFHTNIERCEGIEPALLLAAQNLISNALRYAQAQIDVELTATEQHYWLIVQDDGPGLSEHPDQLQRIFRRGASSSGFGLGLYIVSKVAQWHQGELSIDNHHAGGARICLCWPKPRVNPSP